MCNQTKAAAQQQKSIWTSLKSETMFKLYTFIRRITAMDNFNVDAASAALLLSVV